MSNIESPSKALSELAGDIDGLIYEYSQDHLLDVTQVVGVLELVKISIINRVVEEVEYYD